MNAIEMNKRTNLIENFATNKQLKNLSNSDGFMGLVKIKVNTENHIECDP